MVLDEPGCPRRVHPTEAVGVALEPMELFVIAGEGATAVHEIDGATPAVVRETGSCSGRAGALAYSPGTGLLLLGAVTRVHRHLDNRTPTVESSVLTAVRAITVTRNQPD